MTDSFSHLIDYKDELFNESLQGPFIDLTLNWSLPGKQLCSFSFLDDTSRQSGKACVAGVAAGPLSVHRTRVILAFWGSQKRPWASSCLSAADSCRRQTLDGYFQTARTLKGETQEFSFFGHTSMHTHTHERTLPRQRVFTRLRSCSASQALSWMGGVTALRISQPSSRSARSTTIKILLPLEEGQESKFTAVHVSPQLRARSPWPPPPFLPSLFLFFFFFLPLLEDAHEEKLTALHFLFIFFCRQEALCASSSLTAFDSFSTVFNLL